MSGLVCHFCANPGRKGMPLVWRDDSWPARLVHDSRCRTWDLMDADESDPVAECMHEGLTCDEFLAGERCPPVAPGRAKCGRCFGAVPVEQLFAAEFHAKKGGGGELLPHGTSARGRMVRFGPTEFTGWDDLPNGTEGVILEGCAMCRDCADRDWPDDARRRKWRPVGQPRRDPQPSGNDALWAAAPKEGADIARLKTIWGKSERATRAAAIRFVTAGRFTVTETPTRAGGAPRKTYFPVPVEAP